MEIDHSVEHPLIAEPRDLFIFRFQVRTYDVCDKTYNRIDIALKCPVQQYGNVGVLLPLLPSIEREWELQPF